MRTKYYLVGIVLRGRIPRSLVRDTTCFGGHDMVAYAIQFAVYSEARKLAIANIFNHFGIACSVLLCLQGMQLYFNFCAL